VAFGVAIVRAATDELIERFATSLGVEFVYVRRKTVPEWHTQNSTRVCDAQLQCQR
jgi:hypothetical protein